MGTIYIHHHAHDLFAAEAIAGMLVDCGAVVLRRHEPYGDVIVVPERYGVDWHVVVWSATASGHFALADLVQTLARTRGPLMLLCYEDDFVHGDVRAENRFPLCERDTEWSDYRAGLRRRMRYPLQSVPPRAPPDRVTRFFHGAERAMAAYAVDRNILPVLVAGGVLFWSILHG